ncbi:U-box domain-containing protein 15-like [Cynara cardunculus var. scolymus]|uniref:U-box domain-containing protein 15-like n=1 Tax=Cynara cardunculus var. scolymus TaxID=59895 RepID=UPI000D627D56|nr:U-box domain-containing protein 15-like [Cynara cardunculus var. scolymus]
MEEEKVLSKCNDRRVVRDLVEELIAIIEDAKSMGEFRGTQRKESQTLLRLLKHCLPLLEELRDLDAHISEYGISCLYKLRKAFILAKKLLKTCQAGSKIYLVLETDAMVTRFISVYDKLNQAVEGIPYKEIGISEEVTEQVQLMCMQLKRAKQRTDSQDMELIMDMMAVLSFDSDRIAECDGIKRLASKLSLNTLEDLKIETVAIRKLVKERRGQNAEGTQKIMNLLDKFKRLAGIEQANVLDDPVPCNRSLQKCTSLTIPYEFLCPITLEIMRDPVIIATGQTYERASIQQWLDSDHGTCPKTGLSLTHTTLAPNVALRNLILQWCESNNYQLPKKEPTPPPKNDRGDKILTLIQELSSSQLLVQRKAVTKIRMLSRECPENRVLIAEKGGIPPLVQLLTYPDSKIQEHAVTALLNLSIDDKIKKQVSKEGPIPAIIEILRNGTDGAKENSAAALFSLSMLDENKALIGSSNGIPPLLILLKEGTIRGKKDAASALFNLTLSQSNKSRAIEAGAIKPLLNILQNERLDMVDEALSVLLLLAAHPDGRKELGQLSFIETLVRFIREGTPKNKECAAAVLLKLCTNNSNLLLAALQFGVYEHVKEVSQNGTKRGQKKAAAILQLMSKSEQI